jgi:hypothetical protein
VLDELTNTALVGVTVTIAGSAGVLVTDAREPIAMLPNGD